MYRLEEATRTKLIEEARNYYYLEDFIDGVGYQEWQDEYLESQGYVVDETSDVQAEEINKVLKEIWDFSVEKRMAEGYERNKKIIDNLKIGR